MDLQTALLPIAAERFLSAAAQAFFVFLGSSQKTDFIQTITGNVKACFLIYYNFVYNFIVIQWFSSMNVITIDVPNMYLIWSSIALKDLFKN